MNNVENIILKCYELIKYDSIHHLRLPYRNLIFEQLSPLKKGLLVLKTIKNILFIWDKIWPNDECCKKLYNNCIGFLNGDIYSAEFRDALNSSKTKFDNTLEEGKFTASYVGFALYQAGYEILSENFTKHSIDEFSEDPELWSSLFFASLAYNGGTEGFSNISAERNKVFWSDFLENFRQIINDKDSSKIAKEIISPVEEVKEIARKQKEIIQNPENVVYSRLNKLSDLYFEKYFDKDIKKITLRFYLIDNKITVTGYTESIYGNATSIDNNDLAIYSMQFNFSEKLLDIKRIMYSYAPEEGAWLMFDLTIGENRKFEAEFNYDKNDPFFRTNITYVNFINEMKEFPRKSRFIPNWLRTILIEHDFS